MDDDILYNTIIILLVGTILGTILGFALAKHKLKTELDNGIIKVKEQ